MANLEEKNYEVISVDRLLKNKISINGNKAKEIKIPT